jgi:hypothetical protein
MNKMNSHGTFANGRRYAFHAASTRVSHRKNAGHACFKQQRRPFEWPRKISMANKVGSRDDEALLVQGAGIL